MTAEGHKRFRKRGGAKKKKKAQTKEDSSTALKEVSGAGRPVFAEEDRNVSHPQNIPGFTSGFNAQSDWPKTTDPELQSYLEKLQEELEKVDPGAEAALAYIPNDEEPPESVLLSRNALTELSPRLAELSRNNHSARFIEVLLRTAKSREILSEALDILLSTGASRVADLASHRCASHVLQTLLVALREMGEKLDALNPIVSAWTAQEIMGLISSPSGSHVLRVILAGLSGLPNEEPRAAKLDDSDPRKIMTYLDNRESVSDESLAAVTKIASTLLEADVKIHDLLWYSSSSAALQGLLSAVTVADKEIAKRLGEECLKAGFSNLVNDPFGSRFVERLILCLGTSIVAKDVKGHLAELAKHPKGNFAAQRYLLGLQGRGAVMTAWDELEQSIPSMLGLGKVREGVVLALLRVTETQGDENCRRRASRAVARACGAVGAKAKSLAGFLAMGSEEVWTKWKQSVHDLDVSGMGISGRSDDVLRIRGRVTKASLLGILIARCLMRFPGGPGQATRDSMAALTNAEILALIADPCGSRLVEQWIQDERIERSMKIASNLFNVIWECGESKAVLAVARNPYGAMVIVRCCSLLRELQRKQMMDALASDFENLRKHESGQVVIRKCRVEHYMRKGDEWEHEESAKQTRQRLFAEILEDEGEIEGISEQESRKRKRDKDEKALKKRKRAHKRSDITMSYGRHGASDEMELLQKVKDVDNMDKGDSNGRNIGTQQQSTLTSVLKAIESAAKPSQKKRKSRRRSQVDEEGKD